MSNPARVACTSFQKWNSRLHREKEKKLKSLAALERRTNKKNEVTVPGKLRDNEAQA